VPISHLFPTYLQAMSSSQCNASGAFSKHLPSNVQCLTEKRVFLATIEIMSKNSRRALRNFLKTGDYNTVGETVSVRECAVRASRKAVDRLL